MDASGDGQIGYDEIITVAEKLDVTTAGTDKEKF